MAAIFGALTCADIHYTRVTILLNQTYADPLHRLQLLLLHLVRMRHTGDKEQSAGGPHFASPRIRTVMGRAAGITHLRQVDVKIGRLLLTDTRPR